MSLSVGLSVCLSAAVRPHYCMDPDVTWGRARGCPLVVHYWADLQSGHGLRCYGNITRTRNVSECMLVLPLCLVFFKIWGYFNCRIETEGFFKVAGSHIHCKIGNISETVQDRDVVTTDD